MRRCPRAPTPSSSSLLRLCIATWLCLVSVCVRVFGWVGLGDRGTAAHGATRFRQITRRPTSCPALARSPSHSPCSSYTFALGLHFPSLQCTTTTTTTTEEGVSLFLLLYLACRGCVCVDLLVYVWWG